MKIITKEELGLRIAKQFHTQDFKILEYTKITKPFTIQCLKCQKVQTHSSCSNFLIRKILCNCMSQHDKNKEKILNLISKNSTQEFKGFDYNESSKKHLVKVHCSECQQTFSKSFQDFLKNQSCSFCGTKQKMNTQSFSISLPKEYSLLSEYKHTENKVLIRHECGFIWKIKPHVLMAYLSKGYVGCPKCNHKRSKGEQKIESFLKNKNIRFEIEKHFIWSSNPKIRYDFFLQDYNLIIEYNGQQHYMETNFFHDTLAEQKEKDLIKENEAKEHGLSYLVIPYYDFKNIEEILAQRLSEKEQHISV